MGNRDGMLGARQEGEGWAARLPDLRTQALRVAAAVAMGVHGRRRPGPGDSFWQYRPYQSGDAVRGIDWRRSARGERVFIREREWEAAQSFWIWLDRSPSMAYSSDRNRPDKGERAAVMAIALASLLLRSGERVGWIGTDRAQIAGTGERAMDRLIQGLAEMGLSAESQGAEVQSRPPQVGLPRHATVFCFSDMLASVDDWAETVASLSAPGVRGHLVHVLDPAEETFPLKGRLRLDGMEGEMSELVRRAEDLAEPYAERFRAHAAGLQTLCDKRGWRYRQHRTDHAVLPVLLALYEAIMLDRRTGYA